MSINIDSLFRNADPVISDILNRTLSEKEISAKEGLELYNSEGNQTPVGTERRTFCHRRPPRPKALAGPTRPRYLVC